MIMPGIRQSGIEELQLPAAAKAFSYHRFRIRSVGNTPKSLLRVIFTVGNRFNRGNNICVVGEPYFQSIISMFNGNNCWGLFFQSAVFNRDHIKSIGGPRAAVKKKSLGYERRNKEDKLYRDDAGKAVFYSFKVTLTQHSPCSGNQGGFKSKNFPANQ